MAYFEARLRRVGNSLGVLVPRRVSLAIGADDGDTIHVLVHGTDDSPRQRLERFIGASPGLGPFRRDRRDRY